MVQSLPAFTSKISLHAGLDLAGNDTSVILPYLQKMIKNLLFCWYLLFLIKFILVFNYSQSFLIISLCFAFNIRKGGCRQNVG